MPDPQAPVLAARKQGVAARREAQQARGWRSREGDHSLLDTDIQELNGAISCDGQCFAIRRESQSRRPTCVLSHDAPLCKCIVLVIARRSTFDSSALSKDIHGEMIK